MSGHVRLDYRYSKLDDMHCYYIYFTAMVEQSSVAWLWFGIGKHLKGKKHLFPFYHYDGKVKNIATYSDSSVYTETGKRIANKINTHQRRSNHGAGEQGEGKQVNTRQGGEKTMKKIFWLIVLALALSGCATGGGFGRGFINGFDNSLGIMPPPPPPPPIKTSHNYTIWENGQVRQGTIYDY